MWRRSETSVRLHAEEPRRKNRKIEEQYEYQPVFCRSWVILVQTPVALSDKQGVLASVNGELPPLEPKQFQDVQYTFTLTGYWSGTCRCWNLSLAVASSAILLTIVVVVLSATIPCTPVTSF